MAHISTAASGPKPPSDTTTIHPLKEVSLVCAASYKLLKDPVHFNSLVVGRGFAALHQHGRELHRPSPMEPSPVIYEMKDADRQQLNRLLSLSCFSAIYSRQIIAFHVENIGPLPSHPSPDLACVGRDFLGAILLANKTELMTRGPLDLKSTNVIPPQIVLDQEVYKYFPIRAF